MSSEASGSTATGGTAAGMPPSCFSISASIADGQASHSSSLIVRSLGVRRVRMVRERQREWRSDIREIQGRRMK